MVFFLFLFLSFFFLFLSFSLSFFLSLSLSLSPDGLVSYSMPQGDRRGSGVDLFDFTYDGNVTETYLSGGLGKFRYESDSSNVNLYGTVLIRYGRL